jgi:hypothetical protein
VTAIDECPATRQLAPAKSGGYASLGIRRQGSSGLDRVFQALAVIHDVGERRKLAQGLDHVVEIGSGVGQDGDGGRGPVVA